MGHRAIDMSPILIVDKQTGKVVFGDKRDHNIKVYVTKSDARVYTYFVETSEGFAVGMYRNKFNDLLLLPGTIKLFVQSYDTYEYIGSIYPLHSEDIFYHIFGHENHKWVYTGIPEFDKIKSGYIETDYREYGDLKEEVYCCEVDQYKVYAHDRLLFYSADKYIYLLVYDACSVWVYRCEKTDAGGVWGLYKQLDCMLINSARVLSIDIGVEIAELLVMALKDGYRKGVGERYFDIIIGLVKLANCYGGTLRVGRRTLHSILLGRELIDYDQINDELVKPNIALRFMLYGQSIMIWHLKSALNKVDDVRLLRLQDGVNLSGLQFRLNAKERSLEIVCSLCNRTIYRCKDDGIEWWSECICDGKKVYELMRFFMGRYSLKNVSNKITRRWASLLKHFNTSQIIEV